MSRPRQVLGFAALLLLAGWLWWTAGGEAMAPPVPEGPPAADSEALTAPVPQQQDAAGEPVRTVQRQETAPEPEPATGNLRIRATYAEDGTPVPGLTVAAGPPGIDHRTGCRRARTDASGMAFFEGLPAGRIWVQNTRNDHLLRTEITAGEDNEVELVLPEGPFVQGLVVDRDGIPVAGAQVIAAPLARVDVDVEHVADTDAEGRFALRSCSEAFLIGARAAGHAPSRLQFLFLGEDAHKEVRIELPGAGGDVAGTVFGPGATPVAGALVCIGKGEVNGITAGRDGAPPPPALVRTDPQGRFVAVGLPPGQHPVRVRAARMAPFEGTCRVEAHVRTPLQVTLQAGMSCTGVVADGEGRPVPKVEIEVGTWQDFAHYRVFSDADGNFRLDGLPPGEIELRAEHDRGKAKATLRGAASETLTCRLQLDAGLELEGRVLTMDGEPVERVWLQIRTERRGGERWYASAATDADGRFTVTNCPEGRKLTVIARGRGVREQRVDDVDPRAGELVIRMHPAAPRSARIAGRVVAPDGSPAAHAVVNAWGPDGEQTGLEAASDEGGFEIGPLAPGSWRVAIEAEGHPRVWTEWREVTAGAVVDLGTIWLPPSGTVRLVLHGGEGLKPWLSLRDAEGHYHHFTGDGAERRSAPVAPGSCVLAVSGRGVAAQRLPVEVRAGEETALEVRLQPGYRQELAIETPRPLAERRIRVLRGGDAVVDTTSRSRTDWVIPAQWQTWLSPGDYTVRVTGDGLAGGAAFTVAAGDNPVVRVVLR